MGKMNWCAHICKLPLLHVVADVLLLLLFWSSKEFDLYTCCFQDIVTFLESLAIALSLLLAIQEHPK
jgi:hypothetical protein